MSWDGLVTTTTVLDDSFVPASGLHLTGGGDADADGHQQRLSGGTTIDGNTTLAIGSDAVLGAAGSRITLGDTSTSGTLRFLTGSNVTTSRPFTFNAGGGIVDTAGNATITLAGVLDGAGSLSKNGTGLLTLTGANSYTGGTFVNAGTLRAGATNVFGTGSMFVNSGATLDLNNFSTSFGSLFGNGSVTLGSANLSLGADNSTRSSPARSAAPAASRRTATA